MSGIGMINSINYVWLPHLDNLPLGSTPIEIQGELTSLPFFWEINKNTISN